MSYGLKSPYSDDETRAKDAAVILEQWLEATWDDARAGVNKADIGFGKLPKQMQNEGKTITLRIDTFYQKRINDTWGRLSFIDSAIIDVWTLDNYATINNRDPRCIKILKYLEEWIYVRQGDSYKGLFQVLLINSGLVPVPDKDNMTRANVNVDIYYVADKLPI